MKKKVLKVVGGATLLVAMMVGVQVNKGQNTFNNVDLDGIKTIAQAYTETSGCVNGCYITYGLCYCYGWHSHEEAN